MTEKHIYVCSSCGDRIELTLQQVATLARVPAEQCPNCGGSAWTVFTDHLKSRTDS